MGFVMGRSCTRVMIAVLQLGMLSATGLADAACIVQAPCANNPSIPIYRLVFPIDALWAVHSPPEEGNIDDTLPEDLATDFRTVMSNWRLGVGWLPADDATMTDGNTYHGFTVVWAPRGQFAGSPDKSESGEGLALAPPGLGQDNGSMECAITSGVIYVNYNPQSTDEYGAVHKIYWGNCTGGCLPPTDPVCGYNCVYDLPATLAHEYGHLLGLSHPSTMSGATMDSIIAPNSANGRSPEVCETNEVSECYKEKYGPSRLDEFIVDASGPMPLVQWSCQDERRWSGYRVIKQDVDGVAWTIAEYVPTTRSGTPYMVYDDISDGMRGTYYLTVRDSLTPEIGNWILVGQAELNTGSSPLGRQLGSDSGASPWRGYDSVAALMEALDDALMDTSGALRRRVFADGFTYAAGGGAGWSESIDRVLTRASQRCWEEVGSISDSLALVLTSYHEAGPGLVAGVADILYRRGSLTQLVSAGSQLAEAWGCIREPLEWRGRVSVMLERVSEVDGWKVRRIDELNVVAGP